MPQVVSDELRVRLTLSGARHLTVYFFVPLAVAAKGGLRYLDIADLFEEEDDGLSGGFVKPRQLSREECLDLTKELANVVGGHFVAALRRGGQAVDLSHPQDADEDPREAGDGRVGLLVTPHGTVQVMLVEQG